MPLGTTVEILALCAACQSAFSQRALPSFEPGGSMSAHLDGRISATRSALPPFAKSRPGLHSPIAGAITAIVGPSGAGRTSLAIVDDVIALDKGTVVCSGSIGTPAVQAKYWRQCRILNRSSQNLLSNRLHLNA